MRVGINAIFLVAGKGGGIERYLRGLISGLKVIDKENEYLLFTSRDCRGTFNLRDNFKEIYCDVSSTYRPAKILWEQFILPWKLRSYKIDVLLSAGNIAPAVHPCPSVVMIYDMIPFIRPEGFSIPELFALKTLFALTAKMSSKIITVSESSKNEIVNRFKISNDKIKVIYGACDEYFRPTAIDNKTDNLKRYGVNGKYILYVASSRPYKNIDGLIKAYKILKDRYGIEHSLIVTGLAGKAQSGLLTMAQELKLESDVRFSGFVNDRDLPLLYSAADIFVYPSFYEGFGLPVLEAMSCGIPVAASNSTSLPEVVGNAGLLFDPHNTEQMAEVIYNLIKDSHLRKELVKKGFERVKEFSWEKTAMQVLSVLKKEHLRANS